jgi:hypothetical protein
MTGKPGHEKPWETIGLTAFWEALPAGEYNFAAGVTET